MTEAVAVIVGAVVGAFAGVAGGGFAALASLRASQLSARAPLGPVLHEITNTLAGMSVAIEDKDTEQYLAARREFERKWSEFSIQQRILCPSERIVSLLDLIRVIGGNQKDPPAALLNLGGQTIEKITQMISAYGNSLFRFRARKEEGRIIQRWLESEPAELLSAEVRTRLKALI